MKKKKAHLFLYLIMLVFLFFPITAFAGEEIDANNLTDLDTVQDEVIQDTNNTEEKDSSSEIDEEIHNEVTEEVSEASEVEEQGSESEEFLQEEPVQEETKTEEVSTEETNTPEQNQTEERKEVQKSKIEIQSSQLKSLNLEKLLELKNNLVKLGFLDTSNPSQRFDEQTKSALIAFQKYFGLQTSGDMNDATWNKINDVLKSPYQKGKRHKNSITIKENLNILGYAKFKNPTNYFGKDTEAALKKFQADYDLPVSGIADSKTFALLKSKASGPLQKGMRRSDAIQVKKDLVRVGFASFKKPNNYFGPSSEKAIRKFQKHYGLTENGIVDQPTLNKIQEILSSPYQKGKRHSGAIAIKENLTILGYANFKNPTTLYGASTEKAVKAFQKAKKLPISGIADSITVALLEKQASTPLEKGMKRNDAIKLKENLVRLGFASFKNPNNYYGSQTEKAVRKFQSHFGLSVNGIADKNTILKINEIVSSPFQKGKRHKDSISIKQDLDLLGYVNFKNPNNFYGSSTEKAVKAFQRDHKLPVTGIADPVTRAKITEKASKFMKKGTRNSDVIQLKKDLNRLGFSSFKNPTNLYGSKTAKAVKDFQKYYGLKVNGVADNRTLKEIKKVLSNPLQKGKRHKDAISLKEDLTLLGYANFKNPTNLFGSSTEKALKKFQKDKGLPISGIADKKTLRKLENSFVKVFLDPGHGGKDPGASGYGIREKDVVLDIALKTADVLTKKYKGVKVKLSRTNDTFIELIDRSIMANDWDADLFISFHNNAFNGKAKGFESFIHNSKASNKTKAIQKDMHNYLMNKMKKTNRGMKTANFSVLRNTNMSAVLIEYLFIDNYSDNLYLRKSNNRANLGKWTAEAIADSLNLKKR